MIKTTLLTSGNQKILKGEKMGFITKGIHLAPANLAGYEVCQWRSKGCTASCLNTAGRGQMNSVQQSRIAKTKLFFDQRKDFMIKLCQEIASTIKSAKKKNMKAVFRLNLTSDIKWEDVYMKDPDYNIFEYFWAEQFYDYTKSFRRMCAFLGKPFTKDEPKFPSNYHLTFSRSENNDTKCEMVLAMGGNVAVVFRNQLPDTWKGYEVVNGDDTDLRFLDKRGVVVGLIEKGMAKKDATGFVQEGVNS